MQNRLHVPLRMAVSVTVVLCAVAQFLPMPASAVFTQAYVRLDRMKASTASGGLVCAKPATVGTEDHVIITFPTDFTLDTTITAGHWTVDTSAAALSGTGATAWPGPTTDPVATAVVDGSGTESVTFSSGDLTVGTLYCFAFTAGITSTGAAANSKQGSIENQTSGNAAIDHTDLAWSIITDDQVVVSATVPPIFSLTLQSNADAFGNLDPTAVSVTTGNYAEISTNAKGGWITWVKSAQQGLHSTNASKTIATTGTLSSGTYANGVPDGTVNTLTAGAEGYAISASNDGYGGGGSSTCTISVASEYSGSATTGGSAMGNYQPVGSCNSPTDKTRIRVKELASIGYTTPASSDYGDTLTIVAAGNF